MPLKWSLKMVSLGSAFTLLRISVMPHLEMLITSGRILLLYLSFSRSYLSPGFHILFRGFMSSPRDWGYMKFTNSLSSPPHLLHFFGSWDLFFLGGCWSVDSFNRSRCLFRSFSSPTFFLGVTSVGWLTFSTDAFTPLSSCALPYVNIMPGIMALILWWIFRRSLMNLQCSGIWLPSAMKAAADLLLHLMFARLRPGDFGTPHRKSYNMRQFYGLWSQYMYLWKLSLILFYFCIYYGVFAVVWTYFVMISRYYTSPKYVKYIFNINLKKKWK